MKSIISIIFLSFLAAPTIYSQNQRVSAGIVFKPIIPAQIFRTNSIKQIDSASSFLEVKQKASYSFGMNIRKGMTKNWAMEGGIFFTKRRLSFEVLNKDNGLRFENNISVVSYEIPLQALLYVRLTDKLYTDASAGFTLNFLSTYEYDNENANTYTYMRRRAWVRPSLVAGWGLEWRTEEQGFFYIGMSFNQFLQDYYSVNTEPVNNSYTNDFLYRVSANYFSLDFKYFFAEDHKNER